MTYQTILTKKIPPVLFITINRPERNNSINTQLLTEINLALDEADSDKECLLVVLEGKNNFFCSGLDFEEILSWEKQPNAQQKIRAWALQYMNTLRRFSLSPKIIVSKLEGKVIAGGTGLVAASDYVIATENTTFKLTEALWGLLPAMVAPYLIKRIGNQKAFEMTLSARTVTAEEAKEWHLIDQVSGNFEEVLDDLIRRTQRLKGKTIVNMKSYFRELSLIDEHVETAAMEETVRLLQDPLVKENIRNFVEHKKLP